MSRRCSSSDFMAPGEMESAIIGCGRLNLTFLFSRLSGKPRDSRSPGRGRDIVLLSGVNSTFLQRKSDPVDCQHVGGNPVIHLMSLGVAHDFLETAFNYFL